MKNLDMITANGMPAENGGIPQEEMPRNEKKTLSREKKRLIFYILMLIFPLANFALFYVYVNIDMFKLAFTSYDYVLGKGYIAEFVWFENFEYVFNFLSTRMFMVGQSMLFYLFTLCMMPIAVIFSYYVYKGYPAANFFRVILYLPSIFSGIVMVLLYRYMFSAVFKTELLLGHILFYNVWASFGMNMIMYIGAMCGINTSIPESAQLDGATAIQEFWYITIRMIFPTIRTFLVVGLVNLFTNSANLYTFYGNQAASYTDARPFGYWMQLEKLMAKDVNNGLILRNDNGNVMAFPQLSALGIVITFITLPVTLGVRRLLEKYGPSED